MSASSVIAWMVSVFSSSSLSAHFTVVIGPRAKSHGAIDRLPRASHIGSLVRADQYLSITLPQYRAEPRMGPNILRPRIQAPMPAKPSAAISSSTTAKLTRSFDTTFPSSFLTALTAVPAGASPTTPAPAPGSKRSHRPLRPVEATVLWRTAVDPRGPLPDRIARAHRVPWESAGPSGQMEA